MLQKAIHSPNIHAKITPPAYHPPQLVGPAHAQGATTPPLEALATTGMGHCRAVEEEVATLSPRRRCLGPRHCPSPYPRHFQRRQGLHVLLCGAAAVVFCGSKFDHSGGHIDASRRDPFEAEEVEMGAGVEVEVEVRRCWAGGPPASLALGEGDLLSLRSAPRCALFTAQRAPQSPPTVHGPPRSDPQCSPQSALRSPPHCARCPPRGVGKFEEV